MAQEGFKQIKYSHKGLTWINYSDLCKSCGYCIEKCPVKCLSFDDQAGNYLGTATVKCQIEKCIGCRTCENICPDCAILVEGKK